MIEVKFPDHCTTVVQKREFIEELIIWGDENLTDKEAWRYKLLLIKSPKFKINQITTSIWFAIDNEADAVAIKLAWG